MLLTTTSITDDYPLCGYSLPTCESIRVVGSSVTAIGCLILGADRYCFPGPYFGTYNEQAGVVVESGVFRVGPGTILQGGQTNRLPPTAVGYEVLTPQGSVEHDSRGVIVRPPAPPQPQPVPIDLPATYHSWAVAGEPFGVTAVGPPSGFALLLVGDWAPGQPPGPFGTLAIDPSSVVAVDLVPLSATLGDHDWPNLLCPATAPVAHAFALQALTIAPDGSLGLTEPSPLTVGWPHGVIP